MRALGIIGFGAFGRLLAEQLAPFFDILVFDPKLALTDDLTDELPLKGAVARPARLEEAASQRIVIFAVPTSQLRNAVREAKDYLRPGSLVIDVGSVKVQPTAIFRDELPGTVTGLCTHPLFGPQSARNGIAGHKIVLCPLGNAPFPARLIRFLEHSLKLNILVRTAEEHDRELATVQGITHLVANIISRMQVQPSALSTSSFDLLMQSTEMIRYDSDEVFRAICVENPFAKIVRDDFFASASATRISIDHEITKRIEDAND